MLEKYNKYAKEWMYKQYMTKSTGVFLQYLTDSGCSLQECSEILEEFGKEEKLICKALLLPNKSLRGCWGKSDIHLVRALQRRGFNKNVYYDTACCKYFEIIGNTIVGFTRISSKRSKDTHIIFKDGDIIKKIESIFTPIGEKCNHIKEEDEVFKKFSRIYGELYFDLESLPKPWYEIKENFPAFGFYTSHKEKVPFIATKFHKIHGGGLFVKGVSVYIPLKSFRLATKEEKDNLFSIDKIV